MNITKIYLVENCYGDPNKVYIGKTKGSRKYPHKYTFGKYIIYNEIDEVNSLKRIHWEPLETFWIEYFKYLGFEVQNIRKKGGSGPEFQNEQTKTKIGNKNKGNNVKKVFQYDLEGNFIKSHESIRDANEFIGKKVTSTSISNCCKGKIKSAYKFVWRLEEDSYLDQENLEIKVELFKNKKVYQFDLEGNFIKEWPNTSEPSKKYKIHPQNISCCCIGINNTSGNYIWEFQPKTTKHKLIKKTNAKPILQFDKTGNFIKEWPSITEASIFFNKNKYSLSISRACNGKLKSSLGFIWKYKNN